MGQIDAVIAFWFGPGAEPSRATMQRWFMRDAGFDDEIRTRFGALHAEAIAGGLEDWRHTTRGELALIIVLDQFSRNLHRDDPRAFAQDARALSLARELLDSDRIRELTPIQRMFALMPFEHVEDRATQTAGVAAFEELVAGPGATGMLATALEFARKHAEIIERFGRFPHRNAVLGRVSTPEELAFLEQPGSQF